MPSENSQPAASPVTGSTGRRPGRPTQRILTVESIIDRTFTIAGQEGFVAVTMNRLAREMGVTPRALYNHVANRQEIIDRVWIRFTDAIEIPDLDPENWRDSFHELWGSLRQQFRKHPRLLLVAQDETITASATSPIGISLVEKSLQFFVDIGLTLRQAIVIREMLMADLFNFALNADYNYDRRDEETRAQTFQPVPQPWLDEEPDVDAPLTRKAVDEAVTTSDELFNYIVEARIAYVEKVLEGRTEL